ncbi:MAG: diguanylate cyclase (GGDEF)-like protein/PAS domain S-box-containing protein [Burkholderiaceae bacterium]|jgi:diguanylate cyclase (GGDEF)-like protein/PAS domain S-box-containing protein
METINAQHALSAELQRREERYSLLGELSQSLWFAGDAPLMLQGFCKALVAKAGYVSVQVALYVDNQSTIYEANADQPPPDMALQHLVMPLGRYGVPVAQLQVSAAFDLSDGSQAHTMLMRIAGALVESILALRQNSTQRDLQSNGELLALSVRQSPLAVVITNATGQLEYCNDSYCKASGFTAQELAGAEVLWKAQDPTEKRYRKEIFELKAGEHWQGEVQSTRKNGSTYWERQVVSGLCTKEGQITHWVAIQQDIAANTFHPKKIEPALLLREQALVSSSNGIMITHSNGNDHSVVYVNPAFERITGYSAHEVAGREGIFLVGDDLDQPDLEEIRTALREKREGRALLRNYRKDGTQFWNELTIAPVKEASGAQTTHFVSVINDVSDRLNYQKELEYQATRDGLTGLANRNLLNDRMTQGIASAKRKTVLMGLMLLDLDHFKSINDASGHGAGDEVLKEVSKRLINCVRETDTVARLGGDEFVILLTDLSEIGDVDVIAEKILIALSKPLPFGEHDVAVTASIGISCYPRDGDHGEVLLRYADIAMHRVKEHGRNGVCQFVPEMAGTAIRIMNMEDAMRNGLERGEFRLHYQPKMDMSSGRMVGAEALVRWQHPQIGLIHPIEFITLAEESGLILPLGEWVLAEACRQQVAWEKDGIVGVQISVNISPRQFRQDDLAERVKAIFSETRVDPARIILELSESIVMHDVSTTNVTLKDLNNLGVGLSLDNFGAGYSSLVHLRKYHISELKIDKSLINDIHTNPDSAAIVGAIIAMATSLGLQVVAQGVEHLEQVDMLRQLGCQYVQGYYFGRPLECA